MSIFLKVKAYFSAFIKPVGLESRACATGNCEADCLSAVATSETIFDFKNVKISLKNYLQD